MKTSQEINKLAGALAKAQGAMKAAAKDTTNPHFKSKYADLASVTEAAKEQLSLNGLSYFQDASTVAEGVSVTTRLMHGSGQWIESEPMVIPLLKRDAQGVGSAVTYGRRYSLCAAVGIVADIDDDGEGAGKDDGKRPAPAARPKGIGETSDVDKAARAAYDAKKAQYAVNLAVLPSGQPDWHLFVADLEAAMPNMANMQELSLLKAGNGKNLNLLRDADAALFEHIKKEFETFGNALS